MREEKQKDIDLHGKGSGGRSDQLAEASEKEGEATRTTAMEKSVTSHEGNMTVDK